MRTLPVLVYDGDCGFCTASVGAARRRLHPSCEFVAWQSADLGSLGVSQERAAYELLWVTPGGDVHGGAQAVAKLLLNSGRAWGVLGAVLTLAPVRWIAHGLYRIIAINRSRLPGGTAACAVPTEGPARPDAPKQGVTSADPSSARGHGDPV
ncbi:thiol-disulfide oxidoreductase DCC family protein [Streptomyces sp. NPDC058646]|uniref:thiol-disulfide oxidoreductase DCC family protein n=1 Tax=Streptomyces sp. NPDC058646 TaxID=3346574 RepID=UPI00365BD37D